MQRESTKYNYGRISLKKGLNSFVNSLDQSTEEVKIAYRTARVLALFKKAILHIYKDSAFYVLEKINAVYITNESDKGLLKKSRPDDKIMKVLTICVCDSMVYADLDSRQEFIKHWFLNHGEYIDKFNLVSSKFKMRKKFPYQKDVENLKKDLDPNYFYSVEDIADNIKLDNNEINEINNQIKTISNNKVKTSLSNLINSQARK